jgi:2-oxoisovalerate dehydrogenase E1 component
VRAAPTLRREADPATRSAHEPVDGTPITMPFGDLTVSEGRLVKWYRGLGERVAVGDHVADIETDKALVEIEAPASGVISEVLAEAGMVVAMGASIGIVREVT